MSQHVDRSQKDVEGTANDGETDSRLPKAKLFEILSVHRRQEALRYLDHNGGEATLRDLAEHIASLECDCEVRQLSSKQRKRVYVGLYQCHLPKMDDIGVVDFNQDRGHITLTEMAEDFEKYLDHSETEQDRQWYQYYAAVSVLGAMVLAASVALSLSGSIILGLFSLVVGVAGACSVYHWSVEREDPDSE